MMREALQTAAARIQSAAAAEAAAGAAAEAAADEVRELRRRVAEMEGELSVAAGLQSEVRSYLRLGPSTSLLF